MFDIIAIGRYGVLGSAMSKHVHTVGSLECDITDMNSVNYMLGKYRPRVVINCAGLVKDANASDRDYVRVNSLGPWNLRALCDLSNIKLVHVTTDCVYDGNLEYPHHYDESSPLTPTDMYSRSKVAGEAGHVNVRTSFIGRGKHGLLNWFLNSPRLVKGYSNVWWSGLTADELAVQLLKVASNVDAYPSTVICAGETHNKCEVLGMLNAALNLGHIVVPEPEPVLNRAMCSKYDLFEVPPLRTMIARLAE